MDSSIKYILNPEKTEEGCFVSALGCTRETAFADMRQAQQAWKKTGGIQGYHLVQSFAPGEVSPELAHEIGVEYARRLLGGEYQAVIATHLNTGSLHNHILWNAVSLETGKKYHSNARSYVLEIRRISDDLCREHGLSVIQSQGSEKVGKPYPEWLAEKNGQPTWKTAIRRDVDEAVALSFTWNQFLGELKQRGYTIRLDRKYATLQPPGKGRPVRLKTLGQQYTPEAIRQRILQPKPPRRWAAPKKLRLHTNGKPLRKLTGLQALYFSYLYKMGVMKRKPRWARCPGSLRQACLTESHPAVYPAIHPGGRSHGLRDRFPARFSIGQYAVREDLCRLDKRLAQLAFIREHGIQDRGQLADLERKTSAEMEALLQQRQGLYRNAPGSPEIARIGQQLKGCRRVVKFCQEIIRQSVEMERRLREGQGLARQDKGSLSPSKDEFER